MALVCAGSAKVALGGEEWNQEREKPKPEIDTIGIDTLTSAPLLLLLLRDHRIVPISTPTSPSDFIPVLIGPDALNNQNAMAHVIQVYGTGQTVGIVNATQKQANRFDALVEGGYLASCRPARGQARIAFYGLQQNSAGQPGLQSRYCLPELVTDNGQSHGRGRSGLSTTSWLDALFSPMPAPSSRPQQESFSPSAALNLDDIADKVECRVEAANPAYGEVQADVYIYAMRSFQQQQDYYSVVGSFKYYPYIAPSELAVRFSRMYEISPEDGDLPGTRLLFSEPATTATSVTSYTNSQSETVSTAVGYGASLASNAFGLSYNVQEKNSVTAGTSQTYSVPPVTILNQSIPSLARAAWVFTPTNSQTHATYAYNTEHIWIAPKDAYPSGGEDPGQLLAGEFTVVLRNSTTSLLAASDVCSYPTPFPTWTVTNPEIVSVSPASVRRGGGVFEIIGHQLYPGIVADVLLGGDALPVPNFVPVDDSHIRVVVPGDQGTGPTAVQVNTTFNKRTLPSNNDVQVDIQP